MRYRINQIKLKIDEDHDELAAAIRKRLKRPHLKIDDIEIVKESVDARKKPDIRRVYTLDFSCNERLKLEEARSLSYDELKKELGRGLSELRPVVVGFGPCGIFAALILAEAGMKPLVIERGQPVDERVKAVEGFWNEGILDTESNVQFGEGGAGTFSDGKLTTGIKDIRISKGCCDHRRLCARSNKSCQRSSASAATMPLTIL